MIHMTTALTGQAEKPFEFKGLRPARPPPAKSLILLHFFLTKKG